MDTEPTDTLQTPIRLITDPVETSPVLLQGAMLLAAQLSLTSVNTLGVSVSPDLRATFLDALTEEAKQALVNNGQFAWMDLGEPIEVTELTSADQLQRAQGAVLFVGADASRLQLLESIPRGVRVVVVPRTRREKDDLHTRYPGAGRANYQAETATTLSLSQLNSIKWFEDRYDQIASGQLGPNSDDVYLGTDRDKICRYCDRRSPEVSFSNTSHAFPELIGNKNLVDLLECDECNSHFAKHLDDHFGKWSLPFRSMTRIKGKKNKIPTYESNDEKFRAESQANKVTFFLREGDTRFEFDEQSKTLRMNFELQSYVPMGVFKCFIKMALAAMPEPEASECAHLKKWVRERTHSYESFRYKPLTLFTQFIAGPLPNNIVTYSIQRRRSGVNDCPYLVFVLSYSNFVHQVFLPMPAQDGAMNGVPVSLQMQYFPHPWDTDEHVEMHGPARRKEEDLSSPLVLKGETRPISFAYEKSIVEHAQPGNFAA